MIKTDTKNGLTGAEAEERRSRGLVNVSVENQSKTVRQIVLENIFTYFNFIFLVFSVLLLLVKSYVNMTFLPVIVANTLIGIVQEVRSKRVLDRLRVLNAPRTAVVRDGRRREIPTNELVLGDLCIFEGGNQIGADAVVTEGSVRVNEALITGEADEIIKHPGDALLSGSFVVSGRASAVLEHVGLDSYVSKLTLEAKAGNGRLQTEMMNSLDKLLRVIGFLLIPLGILMYVQDRVSLQMGIQASVVSVIAALVGMIPEGLYLLTSIALAVSVMRLAFQRVLVHEMACVETLARVNVLCVDKTGTITENKMAVESVEPLPPYEEMQEELPPVHQMIGDFVHCMDADNETMHALKEYFNQTEYRTARQVFPFTSVVKYSAVEFSDASYILGAPEKLLPGRYEEYRDVIEGYSARGSRVLLFGQATAPLDGEPLQQAVIPLALVLLNNPIRKEAVRTFGYFQEQGVAVKVISGDNPRTVSAVASKAGIADADRYVDASTLHTEGELRAAVCRYTVFGRVAPEQKRKLIQAFQRDGNVVAMTGDGVNDVLALKSADCSVAMASGSEAAANAAQIVLLDSNFSCMPSVVLEGRRVVNNIQQSASLFLVKNIFSILMAAFVLLTFNRYPLYPTQLSLVSTFTIGIPAFFLALQPNKEIIRGHFLRNVIIRALPAALTDFLVIGGMMLLETTSQIPHDQSSTMAVYVMLTVGMCTLIRVCKPFDWLRIAVCVGSAIACAACMIFVPKLFAIYWLNGHQVLITVLGMLISVPLFYGICKIVDFLEKAIKESHRRWKRRKMELVQRYKRIRRKNGRRNRRK